MEKLKKELTDLILALNYEDFTNFYDNYNVGEYSSKEIKERQLLEFIEDLQDEDEIAEVISEIWLNTDTDY